MSVCTLHLKLNKTLALNLMSQINWCNKFRFFGASAPGFDPLFIIFDQKVKIHPFETENGKNLTPFLVSNVQSRSQGSVSAASRSLNTMFQ